MYTQLLDILPASFLGDISNWDTYLSLDLTDDTLPYKTVDQFLQDPDFSDLLSRSKISTPRRFVGQAIAFYRHFARLLRASDLVSSTFARGLSSFDEAVIKDGKEAQYTDSIQLLASYFVHQKWIAPHVKPVIVSEYCSLVTKFRADLVASTKDWVSFFSCYYELQNRLELFRLLRICCETLRSPCNPPLPFIVAVPGLKSDAQEFSSCVRSLQCSIASIQKVESLFLSTVALPRAYDLLSQGPGLLHKRKFSVWHLLPSTYFRKIGIIKTLEESFSKSSATEEGLWLVSEDKDPVSSSRSSSVASTPTTRSPEKVTAPSVSSPVAGRLIDIPFMLEPVIAGSSSKKVIKKNSPVKLLPKSN